jgi:preprotein translocase subunit SecG
MSILITALLTIWAIIAAFMILVILMQRPKSEGLGAAFGGGMTENLFGAQTTNVLVKFTSYLSAFFFLITFVLSILYAHESSNKGSVLREELLKGQATSTPGASPSGGQSPAASPAASAAVPTASATSSAGVSSSPAASAAVSASPKKP